ncbi:hypothetical protein ACET3X_007522 [Alternaria dauci]|uniref:Uncharacterized protein n=1 Tax=Alternaria dauci TaxID=48095 RepID=A0ABR3UC73_9PLEO
MYKPGGPGYLGYQSFQSPLNPIDEDHLLVGKNFGSKILSAAAKGFMTVKSEILTADMLTVQEVRQAEPGARYCNASTVQTFIDKAQNSVLELNSQLAKQSRIAKQNEQLVSNREMLAASQTAQCPFEALIKKYTRPDGLTLQAVNTVEECLGLIVNKSDIDVLEALLMTISEQLRILIKDIPQQRLNKAFVMGEMAEWFEKDRKHIHSVIEEDLFQQAKLAADTTADERGFRRGLAAGQAVHSDNPVSRLPRHVESYIEACAYDINEKWKHEHMRIAREVEKANWEAGFAAGKATYLEQARSFGYVEAMADQHGPWNAAHARVAGAVLATTYDLDIDKSLYAPAIHLVNAVADGSEDSQFAKALAEAANGPPINLGYPYFHPQPITIPQGLNPDIERYWKEITEAQRHRGERRKEQQATAVDDTDTSFNAGQPTVPKATPEDEPGKPPLDVADCIVPIPEMYQPDHDDFGQTSPTGRTDNTEPGSPAPDPFTWRTNPHSPPPSDTMYGLHGASGFSRRHKPK